MKKIMWLFLLILPSAFASYYPAVDYCSIIGDNVTFNAPCPHDHRDDTDYMKVRHYLNESSNAQCIGGKMIYEDCQYSLVDWDFPQVTGEPTPLHSEVTSYSDQSIPEFTTIGAALALVGAGYIAYRKRK
jgi:hypothetical protein